MTSRHPIAAFLVMASSTAAVSVSLWFVRLNAGVRHGATASWNGWREALVWAAPMLTSVALGILILVRRPDVGIGWVLAAGGMLGLMALTADQYAGYALVTAAGSLPGGVAARLLSHVCFVATWTVAGVLLPHLFPTGRPLSRRWRALMWVGLAGGAAFALLVVRPDAFTDDGLLGAVPSVRNPLSVPASAAAVLTTVIDIGILALFAGMLSGVISMVLRAKRDRGPVRQQVKVVAYSVAMATIALLLIANTLPFWSRLPVLNVVVELVSEMAVLAIPLSLGLAVLRYGLYDIDRIISRTVAYSLVTAVLTASYLGVVTAISAVPGPWREGSSLAVATATLVVAALFHPVRTRVQRWIDRRFDRARFDAVRTIEAFAARMRSETDLEAISGDLRSVVAQTMRPSHVGLWLTGRGEDATEARA